MSKNVHNKKSNYQKLFPFSILSLIEGQMIKKIGSPTAPAKPSKLFLFFEKNVKTSKICLLTANLPSR
jgi:hypothetical protein